MALTTVVRGRAYDWSHAIGRGAATGTGFNYVQTMCLGNDSDIYTANRGNENNFGMRVNRIRLGGAGDEELLAEFFQHGEGDGKATWPFGVAVGQRRPRVLSRTNGPTPSRCSMPNGKFQYKCGKTGSGDGELLRPAGLACEKNGNLIVVDSGNNRLQVFSPEGKLVATVRQGGIGRGRVQPALGHHARQGRQHLRRGLEEPPRPEAVAAGPLPDEDRQVRDASGGAGRLCRDLSGAVRLEPAESPSIRRRACSITRPTSRWIRTATSMSPTGAIIGSASSRPTARR